MADLVVAHLFYMELLICLFKHYHDSHTVVFLFQIRN